MPRLETRHPRWLAFVHTSPDALAFHNPTWAELIADCYGYESFVFALTDDAGDVQAGVPFIDTATRLTPSKWVSLPFTDFCPALARPGGPLGELVRLLDFERRAAGVPRVEIRGDLAGTGVTRKSDAVRHLLELDGDPDAAARRFRPEVRRHIRKALREGVAVRRATSIDEFIGVFYRLHLDTRRRLGVPVQPRRFFRLLWERIIERGLGFCSLAFVGGAPAAAVVLLASNARMTYKYAASDHRFLDRRPNHLLISEAITWGCQNGFREFDFGRSDLRNAGLRRFKSTWGAVEEPLVYSSIGRAPRSGPRGSAAAVLEPLIRHSPRAVCRLAGELLYKYSA